MKHLTLVLTTVLHTFTHAYGTLLVPLYLLIAADLHLGGVKAASLVVSVYTLAYFGASFPAGMVADRCDRKLLLGVGLLGNAAAVACMGLTGSYGALLALAVVAGLFGSLFHPSASALVPAHYPRTPGMAIGLLGMGAGMGFFLGPQFAGWRAQAAGWRAPCWDLGLAGAVFALVFLALAREAGGPREVHRPLGKQLRRRMLLITAVLGLRDFAGISVVTLCSIYLQKALGRSVAQAGFILGAMMLCGVVMNPLSVYLSAGRRLRFLCVMLLGCGAVLATTPLWGAGSVLLVLAVFQSLHLGSYAVADASMLERVSPAVRGRIIGMYLSLAGTVGSAGPWLMGLWTDLMHEKAYHARSYLLPFATLAAMLWIASLATLLIPGLGAVRGDAPIAPLREVDPDMLEA